MKKRPAKKSAPTPKRKYTTRKTEEQIIEKMHTGGGEDQLFKIEKYEGLLRNTGFRSTENFLRLKNALKHLKVKEAFVIRKEWKAFAHRIVQEEQYPIKIVAVAIAGNDAQLRVVRIS